MCKNWIAYLKLFTPITLMRNLPSETRHSVPTSRIAKTRFRTLVAAVSNRLNRRTRVSLNILHAGNKSWTQRNVPEFTGPPAELKPAFRKIELLAKTTQQKGAMPLWSGYDNIHGYPAQTGARSKRTSDEVRTTKNIGAFYTWLVVRRRPQHIIEIGGAFGVSGMYWTAGLMHNDYGQVYSFEPNDAWIKLAEENISQIGDRAKLIAGTFEANQASLPEKIDLAFIDAIHTRSFVLRQLHLVLERAVAGSLIILDDINFSSEMQDLWRELARDPHFTAAFEVNDRVGILELCF